MRKVYLFALVGAMSAVVAFNACNKDKDKDNPANQGITDAQSFATCVKEAGGNLEKAKVTCMDKIDWDKLHCDGEPYTTINTTDEYTKTVYNELRTAMNNSAIGGDITTSTLLLDFSTNLCLYKSQYGDTPYNGGDEDGNNNEGSNPPGTSISTDGKFTITAQVENGNTQNIDVVKAEVGGTTLASGAYVNGGFTLTLPSDVSSSHLATFGWGKDVTVTPANVKVAVVSFNAYKGNVISKYITYGRTDYVAQVFAKAVFMYADKAASIKGTTYTNPDDFWGQSASIKGVSNGQSTTANLTLKKGWNTVYEIETSDGYPYSNTAPSGLKWVANEYKDDPKGASLVGTTWVGDGIICSVISNYEFVFIFTDAYGGEMAGTYTLSGNNITTTVVGLGTFTGTINGNQMTLTIDGDTLVLIKQ